MEYLDVVDDNGQPTGRMVERRIAHSVGIMHRTSHVWLIRVRNHKLEVLVQKRSDTKESFPGCYDISSAGHIPAGADYISSAIRELKEELGIEASKTDLIFCGDRKVIWDTVFEGKRFLDRQYCRIFVLWCDLDEEDFYLQKEEVSAVSWMELDKLIDSVKGNKIPHCIHFEELYMIQRKLLEKNKWC